MDFRSKNDAIVRTGLIAAVLTLLAADKMLKRESIPMYNNQNSNSQITQTAYFAAGCFWGVEYAYQNVPGVTQTAVGFMGGDIDNPSYKRICAGDTNHAEVVQVVFDPDKVSYKKLVEYFFKIHDPTTPNRQGPDIGTQYRSSIFYTTDEQFQIAHDVTASLQQSRTFRKPIVTQLVRADNFWKAEDYHQKYFDSHPERAVCHPIPKFE